MLYIFEYKNKFADLEIKFSEGCVEEIEINKTKFTKRSDDGLDIDGSSDGNISMPPNNDSLKALPVRKMGSYLVNLIKLLDAYFSGERCDFSNIPVNFSEYPYFSRKILKALQTTKYGEVISYGELAVKAGLSKKYSRACAHVLSKNKTPIIIPCHRVIMGSGKFGGFTGGDGISFKAKLLALERQI